MSSSHPSREIVSTVNASWRSLIVTDLLYKLFAFAVLTPLFVLLTQSLLALSGSSVLSDVDIARFFAGPVGWVCAIVLGSIWLAIMAQEQAALLSILAARSTGKTISATAAVRFSLTHTTGILNITTRLIGWTLLVIAPFLLVAGVVYFWLLGEYDINYYLNEHPSEFKVAVAVGALLVLSLLAILLRLYSGWFLSLSMVVLDGCPANVGLRESGRLISGNRRSVFLWLLIWLVLVFLSNVLVTAAVGGMGRLLIPSSVGSIAVLAARVGLMLLLLAGASLVLGVLASILFAAIQFHGFRKFNPNASTAIANSLFEGEREEGQRRSFVTRTRLLASCVIASLVVMLMGYWSLNSVNLEDDVQIMAHRGSCMDCPENTMAAFRAAIADGADWIELDVQETADGEVVVAHDSDFMKLAGNPLKVWDATLEDLADIDVGSWFDPKFSQERVPTLAEVLALCKGKIGVNIELKYYGHDQQLERRVVEIVEAADMVDQVMIMSLKPEGVAKVKALRPTWTCGLLLSVHLGELSDIDADFLAVNSSFLTHNFVQRAHRSNKQVFVWTVNDVATMGQVLNRNVDGILTDTPSLAREVLVQRSEMSNGERLLAELSIFFDQPNPVTQP